ncbi:hypothetical protein JCM3770_000960 [Rhodotorula araucariae]
MFRSLIRAFSRAKSTAARSTPDAAAVAPASSARPQAGASSAPPAPAEPPSVADATLSSSSAPATATATKEKPAVRSPTDPAADYKRRLEERFGGAEASALGTLVNGEPEGLAPHVKRNMFRII